MTIESWLWSLINFLIAADEGSSDANDLPDRISVIAIEISFHHIDFSLLAIAFHVGGSMVKI